MSAEKRYYVKEWRELRGLTQEQLAELAGVNQGTISNFETVPDRDRKMKVVQKLAKALGIEWWQLQQEPGSQTPQPPGMPSEKAPEEMSIDELWSGFDALYLDGRLSEDDIYARLLLLRKEMRKRGIG